MSADSVCSIMYSTPASIRACTLRWMSSMVPWHVHLVDVLPRPLVAHDVAEARLLHGADLVGGAPLLDPREVLVGDGER